jgi:RNA polymerase sigma-70 factor (ECF subfamily)
MMDSRDNPMGLPPRSPNDAPQSLRPPKADANSPESDELLLRRVGEKDQQAMANLFDRYGGLVYSEILDRSCRAEDRWVHGCWSSRVTEPLMC